MFSERDILYFSPFYFKNGNKPKNKFFVVLKELDGKTIIASLPTSHDHIPKQSEVDRGCIEIIESCLNCFVMSPLEEVTECGKKFRVPTYMYGSLIDEYEVEYLENMLANKNCSYEIWGRMKLDLFSQLLDCFRTSKFVKKKYQRAL